MRADDLTIIVGVTMAPPLPATAQALDPALTKAIRALACCPATGELAQAVEAARKWVDEDRARMPQIVRIRPAGESEGAGEGIRA